MGCDIHITAQRRDETGKWIDVPGRFAEGTAPFDWRSYGMFAFLAGVRNYSAIVPIAEPRGLPADVGTIEDRRVRREISPGFFKAARSAEPGDGKETTLRAFLDAAFFDDLAELQRIGAERVIFGFDS